MSAPQVTPHNAESNLTFRLMSTFCYLAEKPNLKITLIYICLCSNNAFQIRAGNYDIEVDAGVSWMKTPFRVCGRLCVFRAFAPWGSSTGSSYRAIPLKAREPPHKERDSSFIT